MGDDLGCNNIQKHREQTVPQNQLDDEDKRVREETFSLIFRLNTVLHNSYQAHEIVMEIEKWQQKVPDDYIKALAEFYCVRDINCILKKLYYMNLQFDYS